MHLHLPDSAVDQVIVDNNCPRCERQNREFDGGGRGRIMVVTLYVWSGQRTSCN